MTESGDNTEANGQPARPAVRLVVVSADEAGQRLDNFLLRRCPGVPKSHVYRIVRKGEVRVDGGRAKPARKLLEGETVRIPPIRLKSSPQVRVPDAMAERLQASVVEETDDYLVVAKPPGVPVHGGTGLEFGLVDALRQARAEPSLELVHRLDRDTSGLLLIARSGKSNRALQNLFRERAVDKRYLGLAAGRWPEGLTRISAPLAKNVEHAGERRVVVDPNGQSALSEFHRVEAFDEATLLSIQIHTGRTHQIRVHAEHAGHALVGDRRYGDNRTNQAFRARGLDRLFLHAHQLSFPWQGQTVQLEVAPDEHWQGCLARLRSARIALE